MINLDGKNLWGRFDAHLASFAQKNGNSRGRKFPELVDPNRLPFQRDRDRIIHTSSFRRLKGKMQVVAPNLGDHFRNRLSHTLEVSQIARDICRELRLNEDLAEAIALAHDLGHTPFGHAGEVVLDKKMQEFGKKFDHNSQSLRMIEFFENRYRDFAGLNLSLEVLEGVQKHETSFVSQNGDKIFRPHLEGQVVDLADEIAYLSADLEDGLRGNFFSISDLKNVKIPASAISEVGNPDDRSAIIRKTMNILFRKMIEDTKSNIKKFKIETLEDVQNCPAQIVSFSPDFFANFRSLKKFLFENFYCAPEIITNIKKNQQTILNIFNFLLQHPEKIPENFFPEETIAQRICDYIAGMTDRFALDFEKENC